VSAMEAVVPRSEPEAMAVGAAPRILVVDDDAAFRRLCKEYLRDHPVMSAYEISEAATAADALALARTLVLDCVLLDYRLPDASGTMLLRELRSVCGSLTPMIMLTGLGSEDVAIEALHAGAADYIPKDRATERSLGRAVGNAIERARLLRSIDDRNQRLQRVNDELQRTNDQIRQFYHAVSHEIKTPLTAAREFVALVADGVFGKLSDHQREALGYALESCDQMASQFNELLESTRLETGKLRLEKGAWTVHKLIAMSLASVRTAIQEKKIVLEETVEPGLPELQVDGPRIVQVIANLLSNAEKFTGPGGHIGVFAEPSRTLDGVTIGVRDTGCGIGEQDLPRIFDRLYQADSRAGSLSTRGLGLGLSIAQEIVTLHGGTIVAESQLGSGSTFYVHLPHETRLMTAATVQ
jgi:two-component system sensor histidine kinase/response regulator